MSAFWGPERGWLENRPFSREAGAIPFGPIKSLSKKKARQNAACFEHSDIWMPILLFRFVWFGRLFSFNISIPDFDIQITSNPYIPSMRKPQGPLCCWEGVLHLQRKPKARKAKHTSTPVQPLRIQKPIFHLEHI